MYDDSAASQAAVCVRLRLAIEGLESAMTIPPTISEGASRLRDQAGAVPSGPPEPELCLGGIFGSVTETAVE